MFNCLVRPRLVQYPIPATVHSDERGCLFEIERNFCGGQSFVSSSAPGVRRGDHYHTKKIERFAVLKGSARIVLRRLFDSRHHEFLVSGNTPTFLDIPTYHTHFIENIGSDELLTLFWTNEHFDPANSDTFSEVV